MMKVPDNVVHFPRRRAVRWRVVAWVSVVAGFWLALVVYFA